uniref:bacterial Ig-like domain-containing protein n=3 Tax=Enterococcus faecalis TaxID=1351 RepID=UPI00163CC2D3
YTVSKATHPLFTIIQGAEVKNLILNEETILNTSDSRFGGLTGLAENTKINNVHVTNSTVLSSSADKVVSGGLIGESRGSIIMNSTVQDTKVSGSYVGGIIGIANDTKLLNVYSTGEVKNSISSDPRIGGIIGNGYNYTQVKNSYSMMKITNGNGMLGSDYTGGKKNISFENSVSLAEIETANKAKFYNYGVSLDPWKNNFEIQEYAGKTSTTLENLDVSSISLEQVNQSFFADQLNWKSESIWGVETTTSEKELPYLKNSDPRNKQEEDLSDLTLKTEHKEIYVGEELDLADLIDEVHDKAGQLVDKKEVEIIGTVDNSKPGETVIVYKYNTIEKKVTVVVKENKASITVHDSTIYVGDTWKAKDNFDGATDKEGQVVSFEEITVGGDTVDTTKEGRYEVLYSYEGVESKAVVTVKAKQASITVHDSTIYVGDTWEAKDNFDGATDKEGQVVSFEEITVGGDTVDTTKEGRYEVLYSYEDIESKAIVTVKETQTTAFEKETKITFLEDNETGTIIDPEDPNGKVDPVDPTNPNGAELMITYASNLNFGLHKAKTATTFNALADKVWVDETHTETREVTPFVATKDSRGATREGWVLTARQESEFIGANNQPLKGAELSLSKLSYADLVGAPVANVNKIVLSQEAKDVAKAGKNQGVGAWTLAMGQLDRSIEQGEDKTTSKTTSGITLSLPANTVIDTQTYATTITWELATDPTS